MAKIKQPLRPHGKAIVPIGSGPTHVSAESIVYPTQFRNDGTCDIETESGQRVRATLWQVEVQVPPEERLFSWIKSEFNGDRDLFLLRKNAYRMVSIWTTVMVVCVVAAVGGMILIGQNENQPALGIGILAASVVFGIMSAVVLSSAGKPFFDRSRAILNANLPVHNATHNNWTIARQNTLTTMVKRHSASDGYLCPTNLWAMSIDETSHRLVYSYVDNTLTAQTLILDRGHILDVKMEKLEHTQTLSRNSGNMLATGAGAAVGGLILGAPGAIAGAIIGSSAPTTSESMSRTVVDGASIHLTLRNYRIPYVVMPFDDPDRAAFWFHKIRVMLSHPASSSPPRIAPPRFAP